MGQIISNLCRWFSPKARKNETTQKNDQSNNNYQTYYVNDADNESNQQEDHYYINISDHFEPVSGPRNDDYNSGLEYYSSSSSAPHIVLDLIDESGEELVDDQVITTEVVLEKNVTTAVNYVSYNILSENVIGKIGAYTSDQRLLLVGEGDFSFSASLAVAFGYSARNIIATSLNLQDFLLKNYRKFPKNKAELETRGNVVLHGVDATKMVDHPVLGSMVFDRVIYNFPHAGKFGKGELELRMHQKLISGFLQNAKKMIGEDGEIHITSKSNGFFLGWDIPKLGNDQGLYLIQAVKFDRLNYPGYRTKYGFGGDANFYCNPSKTYKFGLPSNKTEKYS